MVDLLRLTRRSMFNRKNVFLNANQMLQNPCWLLWGQKTLNVSIVPTKVHLFWHKIPVQYIYLLQFAGSWLNLPFNWQLSCSNHNPDSVPLPSPKLTRLGRTECCGHLSLSSFQTWSHNCFSVGINSMISVWLVWRLWLKHLPHTATSCFHPKILWTVRCLF